MLKRTLQRCIPQPIAICPSSAPSRSSPCPKCILCRANIDSQRCASRRSAKAPSTKRREVRLNDRGPEVAKFQAQSRQQYDEALASYVRAKRDQGTMQISAETGVQFYRQFSQLVAAQNKAHTLVAPKSIVTLMETLGVPAGDAFLIGRLLLQRSANVPAEANRTGKKLVLSLANADFVEAIIFCVGQAVMQKKRGRLRAINNPEITQAKRSLARIAQAGTDFRAMVMQGKLMLALGNEDAAIDLWTRAMAAAVAAAEEVTSRRNVGRAELQLIRREEERDQFQLSRPWIELMLIHYERTMSKGKDEMDQCLWAIEIGCRQDDPTAHYYKAMVSKREEPDGTHVVTSKWLYHVTKAAASGHAKAIHELALFYAESGWKYIDDEPPDMIKPTPFDSYPSLRDRRSGSLIRQFLGLEKVALEPEHDVFISAAFPHTSVQRYTIAQAWLNHSKRHLYAPSYLLAAKMLLAETLSANADAPKSALKLRDERYKYASRQDYEDDKPIERPAGPEQIDPPNPWYNPAEAQALLREVYWACQAHDIIAEKLKEYEQLRRSGEVDAVTDESDIVDRLDDEPEDIRKWFWFEEVRQMYEHEVPWLLAEVKRICDEKGWDLRDREGKLLYRARQTGHG